MIQPASFSQPGQPSTSAIKPSSHPGQPSRPTIQANHPGQPSRKDADEQMCCRLVAYFGTGCRRYTRVCPERQLYLVCRDRPQATTTQRTRQVRLCRTRVEHEPAGAPRLVRHAKSRPLEGGGAKARANVGKLQTVTAPINRADEP